VSNVILWNLEARKIDYKTFKLRMFNVQATIKFIPCTKILPKKGWIGGVWLGWIGIVIYIKSKVCSNLTFNNIH
jgi:hypothetical protein